MDESPKATWMAGDSGRGTGNPGASAGPHGARRPSGRGAARGRCGRGAGFTEAAGDCGRDRVSLSRDGGSRAAVGRASVAVSVRARPLELPRGAGAAGRVCESAARAGGDLLRRARVRAPATVWAGVPPRSVAGPGDDWLREVAVNWGARGARAEGGRVGTAGGRRRTDWGGGAHADGREADLRVAGASGVARARSRAGAGGVRWVPHPAANARGGSLGGGAEEEEGTQVNTDKKRDRRRKRERKKMNTDLGAISSSSGSGDRY